MLLMTYVDQWLLALVGERMREINAVVLIRKDWPPRFQREHNEAIMVM